MNQDEAKIQLQSKPLAAALYIQAADNLDDVITFLPDPAFTASQNWPEYALQQTIEATPGFTEAENIITGAESSDMKPQFQEEKIQINLPEADAVLSETLIEIVSAVEEEFIILPEEQIQKEMKHSKKIARIAKKASPTEEIKQTKKTKKSKDKHAQAEDFYSWLKTLSPDSEDPKSKLKKANKDLKSGKKLKPVKEKVEIEKSLKLGEEIVSETLARLLARQGHKEDAMDMYEKLIKKYPQKGSTFAAAIEKLKS